MFERVRPIRPLGLIVGHDKPQRHVLTVEDVDGEEILPVFSFEEEAEVFVRSETPEGGWRVVETTPGKVVSVLCGPCADMGRVALGPSPDFCGDGLIRLVSLDREAFLDVLLGGEKRTSSRRVLSREDNVRRLPA